MTLEMKEHDCPICGKEVKEPMFNRFGEWACSEAHAAQYVDEVRAQRAVPSTDERWRTRDRREGEAPSPRWGRCFGRRRGC